MTMTKALYSIFFLLPPALAHMEMSWPYPLHSKYNPANDYNDVDYSMTSPLEADGSNFPCKGYQNDPPIQPTVSYTAGSTYNMSLAGTATHSGGSCQLSLSYDNGATFRVIKSMIGGCPLATTYDFTIPSYAPAGNALLAWTWQNLEGNREYYMNCAEVSISAGSTSRRRRTRREMYNSFDSLPYIWKANLDGVNDCATTEEVNPVYPEPGPDVVYGDGESSASTPAEGDCDAPTPYGATYKAMRDTNAPAAAAYNQSSAAPTTSSADVTVGSTYSSPSSQTPQTTSNAYRYANQTMASPSTQSTTTVTMDCPDTVVVTVTLPPATETYVTTSSPSAYTTSVPAAACTGTSASCPCAAGYSCQSIGPCEWECLASPSTTTFVSSSGPEVITVTATPPAPNTSSRAGPQTVTVSPVPASSAPAASSGSPAGRDYANAAQLSAYLPCVPGTFICTSSTTWYTCDYGSSGASTDWLYDYPRDVSAGMECLPYLSPYASSTQQYSQQGQVQQGSYRDDRVVRARPDGDCNNEGAIMCTDGGQQFDVCDQGGWVQMGAVAAGTSCQGEEIVSNGS